MHSIDSKELSVTNFKFDHVMCKTLFWDQLMKSSLYLVDEGQTL